MTRYVAKASDQVLLHSMGKRFRITAMFDSDSEANTYMEKHSEAAVIATFGPFVFIADKYSTGASE